jgi:hypothetical protein
VSSKQPVPIFRQFRLRTTLVVPFVVQIVAAVGLVGYLSFRSSQKAVNDLATQLRRELTARIEGELRQYLASPHDFNRLNGAAFSEGSFDMVNASNAKQFLTQVQISPFVYSSYCGDFQGHYLGAYRLSYQVMASLLIGKTGQAFIIEQSGSMMISQNWHKSAPEIKDAIIADVRQFIGKQKLRDNIILILLKQQDDASEDRQNREVIAFTDESVHSAQQPMPVVSPATTGEQELTNDKNPGDFIEMHQVFGDFIEHFPPEQDSLELSFTPSSRPIKKRWRNNRLSAHFVADYFTNFLPIDEDEPAQEQRVKESKSAVTYVANELLENAMKFHEEESKNKVKFGIHFLQEEADVTAVIFATNNIKPGGVDKLKAFIEELLSSDPNDMYVSQVEKSAEEGSEVSGLGLLTMINDYSAKLGWKLETLQGELPATIVTTMAQIKV